MSWFRFVVSFVALLVLINRNKIQAIADTVNGMGSKLACSLHFLQGRTIDDINANELAWPPISPFITIKTLNESCLEARLWFAPFLGPRVACLHESNRLGCVLIGRGRQAKDYVDSSMVDSRIGRGDDISDFAVREPFKKELPEVESHFESPWFNSRAFLVVNASEFPAKIIVERYGKSFNSSMTQAGWSMSKSILAILIGALLKSEDNNIFPEGLLSKIPLKDGANATLEQMLRMTDGMDWDESYTGLTDPVEMLFYHDRVGDPLKQRITPGKCFQYSSKTSNVISAFIKSKFRSESAYLNHPTDLLLRPIGIQSARMETDPAKVFVSSSFTHMIPLDWVRLGVLLANKGIWPATGKRIMDESYVEKLSKATKTSRGLYGMHFWLGGNNISEHSTPDDDVCDKTYSVRTMMHGMFKWYEKLPKGSYFMTGFEGQILIILPKEKLVVLRMGASRQMMPGWKEFDGLELYTPVINRILG